MYRCFLSLCLFGAGDAFSQSDITFDITPTCTNQQNGVILATVVTEDYAPPFDFTWTDVQGNAIPLTQIDENQDDGICSVNELAAGTYCVTVTSEDGCSASSCDVTVGALSTPTISSITPICICPGGYGGVNLVVTGGSGNYGYAWSGPGIGVPNVQNPTVTATGTYSVTVTDSQSGCTATAQATVSNCNVALSSANVLVTPDCNVAGTSTLSIQLPTGYGLAPFIFKWIKVGFGLIETDISTNGFASLSNADAGEYCLNILTTNGCTAQFCGINVVKKTKPVIAYSITPPTNGPNGAIALSVSGQPGPFTYLWATGQTTATISGLAPGYYCVTVTDVGSGCTAYQCINLKSCDGLAQAIGILQAQVTAITTANGGQAGGAINITNVLDQYPGYHFNFAWSNGATTEDISGLTSGWYSVVVTSPDCSGLYLSGSWEICTFSLAFSQTGTSCTVTTLKVTPSLAGSYTYKWNTGVTTQSITATLGAQYCVTVTLVAGCSASACFTPSLKPLAVSLVNLVNATFGNSDGSIQVGGTGGVPPYSYAWADGPTGAYRPGLAPGAYTVTVTDFCGKTATATYYIQCEFGQNQIQGTVTNVSCGNNATGSITLTQLPNIPNPKFKWSNGPTTQNISGLVAGQYTVTVTDPSTGCVGFKSFTVGTSGTANFTVSFNMNPGCYPLSQGSITAIPSNQNQGPFTYSWGTWDYSAGGYQVIGNTQTINNVPAGWYGVVVTNANGCTVSEQALMWPAAPTFTVYPVNPNGSPLTGPIVVCPGQTATVQLAVSGAVPTSFKWTNYSQYPLTTITTTLGTLSGMALGSWSVAATDVNGCQAISNFTVADGSPGFNGTVTTTCQSGAIQLTLSTTSYGYLPPFTYKWSDGPTIKDRTNLAQGNYCVTVTNVKGCTASKCFTVTFKPKAFISATVTDSDCGSACDGKIDINVTSGSHTYLWSNGATTQDVTNLCAGTYTVTITSANCVEQQSFTVSTDGMQICSGVQTEYLSNHGGSYNFQFPYFRLEQWHICFDECSFFDNNECSKLVINVPSFAPEDNCWTGTVTITFSNGDIGQFKVVADPGPSTDDIVWVSGTHHTFEPGSSGSKIVTVSYVGDGASTGDDCSSTITPVFHGSGNFEDIVGFNNDYWFDLNGNVPSNLEDAYFGAWRCGICDPDVPNGYVMNNNQDKCHNTDNWLFTFFSYVPNNFDKPCTQGGTMTIMDFDANAMAVLQTITVPSGVSVFGEGIPELAFGLDENIWCSKSGWCWFDQDAIYPSANVNHEILATWFDPTSCKEYAPDVPGGENPNPCETDFDCPVGMDCHEGTCLVPCEGDGDCIYGECVDGFCVESNECNPDCPDGYNCHEGDCYLDDNICNFSTSVNGGGAETNYYFWHDEPAGTVLTFEYKTFNIEDKIFVNGILLVPCVATGDEWETATYTITGGNAITVTVSSCGSTSSRFRLNITCGELLLLQGQPTDNLGTVHDDAPRAAKGITVQPNPFMSSIGVTVRNVEAPFDGQVLLLDNFGRVVARRDISFEIGHNSLTFEALDNLTDGFYFVVVKKEGKMYDAKKVVKTE